MAENFETGENFLHLTDEGAGTIQVLIWKKHPNTENNGTSAKPYSYDETGYITSE
jgi:hypothetical protein